MKQLKKRLLAQQYQYQKRKEIKYSEQDHKQENNNENKAQIKKLKVLEKEWSTFKESFDLVHHNESSIKEEVKRNNTQNQNLYKEFVTQEINKREPNIKKGIVGEFYRTRSQSPGLREQSFSHVNDSLIHKSKAIKNNVSDTFEIKSSFLNVKQEQNISRHKEDKLQSKNIISLQQPQLKANYFGSMNIIEPKNANKKISGILDLNNTKNPIEEKHLKKNNDHISQMDKELKIQQVKRSIQTKSKPTSIQHNLKMKQNQVVTNKILTQQKKKHNFHNIQYSHKIQDEEAKENFPDQDLLAQNQITSKSTLHSTVSQNFNNNPFGTFYTTRSSPKIKIINQSQKTVLHQQRPQTVLQSTVSKTIQQSKIKSNFKN